MEEQLNLKKLAKLETLINELKEEIESANWPELYYIEDQLLELCDSVSSRVDDEE